MTRMRQGWAAAQDYRTDLVVTGLLAAVVWGGFIVLPGLHIDDEVGAASYNLGGNISMGRWGTSLVRLLLIPGPFDGYFTNVLAVALFAASCVLFAASLGLAPAERRAAAGLAVAFPQFFYQADFHSQADVVPLGYILALAATGLMVRRGVAGPALGVLCLALALAIYQSIILIPVTVSLLVLLRRAAADRMAGGEVGRAIRQVALCAALSVAAAGAYAALSVLALRVSGITASGSYFAGQFSWNKQPPAAVLATIWRVLRGAPRGGSYYGEGLYALVLAPALLLAAGAARFGLGRWLVAVCSLAVLVVSPYGLVIVLGFPEPGRTFVSQGLVFAGIWAIGLSAMPRRAAAMAGVGVVGGFALAGMFVLSRLEFADTIQWQADNSLGTRIVGDIYRKYADFDGERRAVFFYGGYHQRNFWWRANYNAGSFFEWDGGNTDRIDSFLTVSGIADFHAPPPAAWGGLATLARGLPVWPAAGSIALHGDVLIVRLGR